MIYRCIVLIVLILKVFILHINAIPPPQRSLPTVSPTMSLNSCNCIRAKECATYRALVRQLRDVIERMRHVACSSTYDSEPKVCCPTDVSTKKVERSYDSQVFSSNIKDRWVWDRRPITSDDESRTITSHIQNKFIEAIPEYEYTKTNLIDDYYDWKTLKNCPPILFQEKKNFHQHLSQPNTPPYDHHFHQHKPDHHHDHNIEFSNNHHAVHGGFEDQYANNHHDGAIIYPDSRHTIWPKPKTSTSNDRRPNTPTTTISTTTVPTTTTAFPLQKPTTNSPNCGVTLNKRIFGGIEALPGQFPWITRIAYLNKTDNSTAYRCSGSFVTSLHIITAAHCITNLDETLALSHIRIADLDPNDQQPGQATYDIAETFVHPNFDIPKRSNDIGLIKIIRPPNVAVNYGTICLPKLTNLEDSGTGIVAGWSNSEGTLDSGLGVRYLKLPILNNTDCANRYDTFRQGFTEKITIDKGMLCTQGHSNGSDVCRGDSGGPLMDDGSSEILNSEGRYTLLGIVAFGPICGFTNLLPGVYMRVSEFVGWITNTIK